MQAPVEVNRGVVVCTIWEAVLRLCDCGVEAEVHKLSTGFMGVSGCEHDIVWVDVSVQNNAACHTRVQVQQCSGNVHTPAQAVSVCVDAPDWMCHLF